MRPIAWTTDQEVAVRKIVKNVKDWILRNPRHSANEMAKQMDVSPGLMRHILKKDFGLKRYKRQKMHELTAIQKKVRLYRAKLLLRRLASGDFPKIVSFWKSPSLFEWIFYLSNYQSCIILRLCEYLDIRMNLLKRTRPTFGLRTILNSKPF